MFWRLNVEGVIVCWKQFRGEVVLCLVSVWGINTVTGSSNWRMMRFCGEFVGS